MMPSFLAEKYSSLSKELQFSEWPLDCTIIYLLNLSIRREIQFNSLQLQKLQLYLRQIVIQSYHHISLSQIQSVPHLLQFIPNSPSSYPLHPPHSIFISIKKGQPYHFTRFPVPSLSFHRTWLSCSWCAQVFLHVPACIEMHREGYTSLAEKFYGFNPSIKP